MYSVQKLNSERDTEMERIFYNRAFVGSNKEKNVLFENSFIGTCKEMGFSVEKFSGYLYTETDIMHISGRRIEKLLTSVSADRATKRIREKDSVLNAKFIESERNAGLILSVLKKMGSEYENAIIRTAED